MNFVSISFVNRTHIHLIIIFINYYTYHFKHTCVHNYIICRCYTERDDRGFDEMPALLFTTTNLTIVKRDINRANDDDDC